MNWLARLKKQNPIETHPTEPTKPGFVGFVGTPDGHIQKFAGEAPAANDPAAGAARDPDRHCWPASEAMNTAEIDTFTARLARLTDRGLTLEDAERLADRLVIRDRGQDDRHSCFECTYLHHGGRCGNWQRAGVAMRSSDAQLAPDFMHLLQRCDGFKGV